MSSLVYVSRAADGYYKDRDSLAKLTSISSAKNQVEQLTGLLLFSNGFFIQLIEGPHDALTQTFGRIQRDNSHKDIEMLSFAAGDKRVFPNWSMNIIEIKESIGQAESRIFNIRRAFSHNPMLHCIDALEAFLAPKQPTAEPFSDSL